VLALMPGLPDQTVNALIPLGHSHQAPLAWPATTVGGLPLAATLAWAPRYVGWLQCVRLPAGGLRARRSVPLADPLILGVLSLPFGTAGCEPHAPFVVTFAPLALVLAAWPYRTQVDTTATSANLNRATQGDNKSL
jgi:hypothetical protein